MCCEFYDSLWFLKNIFFFSQFLSSTNILSFFMQFFLKFNLWPGEYDLCDFFCVCVFSVVQSTECSWRCPVLLEYVKLT